MSGGTIQNGSSSLTIEGTFTQDAGSFYSVQGGSAIQVVGAIILNGGTVQVANTALPINTPFAILHTPSTLTGTYSGVVSLNPNYTPVLTYSPDPTVYLTLFTSFGSNGVTQNEIGLGGALDFLTNSNSDQVALSTALTSLSGSAFLSALNQLSGVQYANLVQLDELANRRFLKQTFDPFRPDFACPRTPHYCGEKIVWSSFQGGQSFLKKDPNAEGFRLYDVDFTLGAHRYLSSCLALGIAGNYAYDHVTFYQGGTGNGNHYQGALYGIYEGSRAYLFGDLVAGFTHWNINRVLNFDSYFQTAGGRPTLGHVATYGEGGVNFRLCNSLIQPFLGLEYGHYWRAHTTESGGGASDLAIASQNFDDFESRLGGRFYTTAYNLIFSADADWRYRYTHLGDDLVVAFAEFGPEFSILGPEQNRNTFEGAIYVAKSTQRGLIYLEGSGEIGNRFATYGITIGFEATW